MRRTTDGPTFPPRAPGEIVSNAATVDARAALKIRETIAINRPRTELYAIWRDFSHLPEYFPDIESVTVQNGRDSHWVARLPGGGHVEWDAEIVNDIPNEIVAWKTVRDSAIPHAGAVNFRDSSSGTEMRVEIDYEPPGGKVGALVARFANLFGQSPEAKIRRDLRRFKEQVERDSTEAVRD
jgi:uncharacterized membrane protein